MSERQILPHAGHISEFVTDAQGKYWNGTCTQTALEVCLACVEGRAPTQAHMVQITRAMLAQGLCDANGAATLWAVAKVARDSGHNVTLEWDYHEPLAGDWHTVVRTNAGQRPILMQLATGQALTDVETGSHDEGGLRYHAIAICGIQANGYVCADGDNPEVSERFQIYDYATLVQAVPCGLLVLDMAVAAPSPPPPAPPVVTPPPVAMPPPVVTTPLPADWSDDGTTLRAPNGHVVVRGFRQFCLAHRETLGTFGEPIEDEQAVADVGDDGLWGAGTRQLFQAGGLLWVQRTGAIFPLWVGMLWARDAARLVAAQTQSAQLEQQLAATADVAQFIALLKKMVA